MKYIFVVLQFKQRFMEFTIGELIRKKIREMKVTNGYVIAALHNAGIEMSESKFSNKLYGERDTFEEKEVKIISKILKTNFTI